MTNSRVIIAGGGIGGLATALTLHQIGVPCVVFEAVREMRPLGVGINLQPNAVRELYDLGFTRGRSRPRGPAGKRMGAGRAERQRHLLRAARAARRLQLAAIRGAPRPGSTCCCTRRLVERMGAGRGQAREPRDRLSQESRRQRERARRARRRLDLRAERHAAHRRRRHPLGGEGADASRSAADPLGRRDHVARHDLGEADPQRRLVRRPRHASPADGVLSDLASRPADGPLDHQLDRRSHDGQRRGLEAERLVPAGERRRLHPPFRELDLGLARRAGVARARRTASSRTR